MRVEVDRVSLLGELVVPPRLDVRDLEGVADGLDVAGRGRRLRAEDAHDAVLQGAADCKVRKNERYSYVL